MEVTNGDIEAARQWIGSESVESDAQFISRCERLSSKDDAILEAMRARLQVLLEEPAQLNLGDLSRGNDTNIRIQKELIMQFKQQGGLFKDSRRSIGVTVGKLKRPDVR